MAVLDYAGAGNSSSQIGWGYWVILVLNLLSLGLIASIVPFLGLFSGTGIIGDAYAPLLGMFFGVPYTFGQLLIGTLPAICYFANSGSRLKSRQRRFVIALLVVGILAFMGSASITIACIAMPRTHGSSC